MLPMEDNGRSGPFWDMIEGRSANQMPPWGDFFKPDQLDALWAYVSAGERN